MAAIDWKTLSKREAWEALCVAPKNLAGPWTWESRGNSPTGLPRYIRKSIDGHNLVTVSVVNHRVGNFTWFAVLPSEGRTETKLASSIAEAAAEADRYLEQHGWIPVLDDIPTRSPSADEVLIEGDLL